jgi:uncharacterized protein
MTKIAVISDTHGVLPEKAFKNLKDIDLILHAGDIDNEKILEDLKEITKTIAVYGNVDSTPIVSILKEEEIFDIEGLKIHLSHKKEIKNKDYDIVIKGHTHRLEIKKEKNTLFLNPGSINPKKSIPQNKASMIMLTIENKDIYTAESIFI